MAFFTLLSGGVDSTYGDCLAERVCRHTWLDVNGKHVLSVEGCGEPVDLGTFTRGLIDAILPSPVG